LTVREAHDAHNLTSRLYSRFKYNKKQAKSNLGHLGGGEVAVGGRLAADECKLQLAHGVVKGGRGQQVETKTQVHEASDALLAILNGEETAKVVIDQDGQWAGLGGGGHDKDDGTTLGR